MTSRKVLVDTLLASGASSLEEAGQLAALTPTNGNTWTMEVLNTGKIDEQKFAVHLAELFRSKYAVLDVNKFDRSALGILPSRFVFKHHILPIESSETGVKLAT